MKNATPLFDQVIAATGLSGYLAPFVVRRVCATNGFLAQSMDAEDLERALPSLLTALRVYLSPEALERAEAELSLLAGRRVDSTGA